MFISNSGLKQKADGTRYMLVTNLLTNEEHELIIGEDIMPPTDTVKVVKFDLMSSRAHQWRLQSTGKYIADDCTDHHCSICHPLESAAWIASLKQSQLSQ